MIPSRTLLYLNSLLMVASAIFLAPRDSQVCLAQGGRTGKASQSPKAMLERLQALHSSKKYSEERDLELANIGLFQSAEEPFRYSFTRLAMDNANKHFGMGQVDRVIDLSEAITKVDSHWGHPHFFIGLAMMQKGEQWQATKEFEKAISLARPESPELALYHSHLGRLLSDLGKRDQAKLHLQKANQKPPTSISGLENEIHQLLQRGDDSLALTRIAELQALSKNTEMRAKCLWLKAIALEHMGLHSDSVAACRLVLKEPVGCHLHLEALLTLVESLRKQHQQIEIEKAVEDFYGRYKRQLSADALDRLANVLSLANAKSSAKFRALADSLAPNMVAAKSIRSEFVMGHNLEGSQQLCHSSRDKTSTFTLMAELVKPKELGYAFDAALASQLYELLQDPGWDQEKKRSLREWSAMLENQTWQAFDKIVVLKSGKSNKKHIEQLVQVVRAMKLAPAIGRQLVLLYACSDDLPEALKRADEFVSLHPNDVELRKLRAALSLRLGNVKQVAADLHDLSVKQNADCSIDELHTMQSKWESNMDKVELQRRLWKHDYKDTTTHLKREQLYFMGRIPHAVSVEEQVSLLNNAAKMAIGRRSYTEALQILDRAIKMDSTNHQIYELRSWCLVGLNRREEAQKARYTALLLRRDLRTPNINSPGYH